LAYLAQNKDKFCNLLIKHWFLRKQPILTYKCIGYIPTYLENNLLQQVWHKVYLHTKNVHMYFKTESKHDFLLFLLEHDKPLSLFNLPISEKYVHMY
jgi:hypothetical protein